MDSEVGVTDDRARLLQLRLDGARDRSASSPSSAAGRAGHELTAAQRRMLLVDELSGAALAYNVAAVYLITGPVETAALVRAIDRVVARHDVLRLRLDGRGENASAVFAPAARGLAEFLDLSAEANPTGLARKLCQERIQRKFDLRTAGPFRAWLIKLAEDEVILGLSVHHMVFDRQSLVTWARDLADFYRELTSAGVAGSPDRGPARQVRQLPPETNSRGGEGTDLSFWQEELTGVQPTLDLPFDRSRPDSPSYAADEVYFELPGPVCTQVTALAAECATTPFTLLLSAYGAVLARYAGESAVAIGCPFNGRPVGFEECIGFFANSLPVVVRSTSATTVRGLITATRKAMLEAQDHQRIPFTELVRRLAPTRRAGVNPLFQVWFDLSVAEGSEAAATLRLPGCIVSYFEASRARTRFDLELHMTHLQSGTFAGRFIFAEDLFDRETIELLSDHCQTFIENAVANPEQNVADVELEQVD